MTEDGNGNDAKEFESLIAPASATPAGAKKFLGLGIGMYPLVLV